MPCYTIYHYTITIAFKLSISYIYNFKNIFYQLVHTHFKRYISNYTDKTLKFQRRKKHILNSA